MSALDYKRVPLCIYAEHNYKLDRGLWGRDVWFVTQILGGAILLLMIKPAPPNGSCTQDAAGTAVTDQCRSLLICSVMRPRLAAEAPAFSFAWFCIPSRDTVWGGVREDSQGLVLMWLTRGSPLWLPLKHCLVTLVSQDTVWGPGGSQRGLPRVSHIGTPRKENTFLTFYNSL